MTSRAAALAGLRYFADVRVVAAQVGVTLPRDAEMTARFAATDSIDLSALAADAVMLDGVVATMRRATDTADDVRRGLPHVWRGDAADAADAAVGIHLRSARDLVEGIAAVSATVAAAATALGRVQEEKHRTLATLRTDTVAGQPLSTLTADDVEADPEPYRADIVAAVDLFTRTMDVVDAAVSAILTALTDSFRALPAPHEVGPSASPGSGPRPSERGDRCARRRTDIVVSPTAATDSGRGGPDPDVTVAGIGAGAMIAGAALAAASSVGTAAVGAVASVLTHLVDAADTDAADTDRRAITTPTPGRVEPDVVPPERPSRAIDPAGPNPAAPVPGSPRPPVEVEPPTSSVSPRRLEPEVPAVVPAPDTSERAPSRDTTADGGEARGVPSVGPVPRDHAPSRGRADPDDGGGLALAGDR